MLTHCPNENKYMAIVMLPYYKMEPASTSLQNCKVYSICSTFASAGASFLKEDKDNDDSQF